ncbi:hypothetical protein RMB12_14410 [Acinetobacter sp. V117_2]|uniref:hypothetical protein n=1 Tax=Acinetobacter sp. V117_2 TaxID=3072989 RepID=UPI00287D49CA|nr:hypothetical protein [Acinetobacter sp. V117_2]MDS7968213.1 hypothetical protein [Acinetobacter sp. V117_2]
MVSIKLKDKINENCEFISMRKIFEEIREKTDLKKDFEIAELLIPIAKKCHAYNQYQLDDGKPMRLFEKNPSDRNNDFDYTLLEIARGDLYLDDSNIFNNYVLEKWDFYYEFNKLTSYNLEDIDQTTQEDPKLSDSISFDEFIKEAENDLEKISILYPTINYSEPHLRPLFLTDLFTIIEAACLITGDNPIKMKSLIDSGDLNYSSHYSEHSQAVKTIERAILVKKLELIDDLITRESLQKYFLSRGLTIQNFNTDIAMELSSEKYSIKNSTLVQPPLETHQPKFNQLLKENAQLKTDLIQAQQLIKKLEEESNQLTHPALDSNHPNYAPELKLAFELWEEIYMNGKYVESHSKSIEQLLFEKGYETRSTKTYYLSNLAKRIISITNKNLKKTNG